MRLYCVVILLASSSLASRFDRRGQRTSHSYPPSGGHSGTGSHYPHSTGLSGNSNGYNERNYNHNQYSSSVHHTYSPKTEVHHHYHYSPPQRIKYHSSSHPVYHGTLPVYVYEYRNSGSRFDNLLTGLALYNLGRLSAKRSDYNYDSRTEYRGTPGEICKLRIEKSTGEYEETRIDCKLMSSFIWEASTQDISSNTISTTVSVTDALTVKGPSIQVTPGMTCYMIRLNNYSTLLQEYARRSLRNGSETLKSVTAPLVNLILCIILFVVF